MKRVTRWMLVVAFAASLLVLPGAVDASAQGNVRTGGVSATGVLSSSTATFTATASLSHATVSVGNPAYASVDFGRTFATVDMVGFRFWFQDDLFNPGENLGITPLSIWLPGSGFGFYNIGSEPEAFRQIGVNTNPGSSYEEVGTLFLDGAEDRIEIGMWFGSVTIAAMEATVTGTPTLPPLIVRGSGTLPQPWTTAASSFVVDVVGASAPKCGDATPATGSMELRQMRVTYKWGQSALWSASMTSPGYVYASPGPSAVIAGNGSYTITTLRGTVLEQGTGYIKAGVDAGTTGGISGYVDPNGPQGPMEFPTAGQGTMFTGNVAILNHHCATSGGTPTPVPSS